MDTVFYCKILPKKKRIRTLVFTSGPPYHLTGPRNFGVFWVLVRKKGKGCQTHCGENVKLCIRLTINWFAKQTVVTKNIVGQQCVQKVRTAT